MAMFMVVFRVDDVWEENLFDVYRLRVVTVQASTLRFRSIGARFASCVPVASLYWPDFRVRAFDTSDERTIRSLLTSLVAEP